MAVAAILLGAEGLSAASLTYQITDLGTLGGVYSQPSAINADGLVAGSSYVAGNAATMAFRWNASETGGPASNPAMLNLGTLGGPASYALSLNRAGQVAGYSQPLVGGYHAFVWTAGGADGVAGNPAMRDLGTLGGATSKATAINDSGQVAGYSATAGGPVHAFRTAPGAAIAVTDDLGTLGGSWSNALGMNNLGQVVGKSAITGESGDHAFRTGPNQAIQPGDDLGTLGGSSSQAWAINDAGQVVGFAMLAGDGAFHAFRTEPGGLITAGSDLGTLGGLRSQAYAINHAGQVVGDSTLAGDAAWRAFLFDQGTMHDLNTLLAPGAAWVVEHAYGINDQGWIVGSGMVGTEVHAFLLTPVPEPSCLGGLLLAAALTLGRRPVRQRARSR